MKKIYTFVLSTVIGFSTMGQATKRVLVEAFSNASCGPCAVGNPTMNALLDNNTSKAIPIKYQVNWPGSDPMNAQNPAQVQTKRTFYAINAVPGVMVDGVTGPVNSASINQAQIDNAFNPGTDVGIVVTHSFNSTFSTIDIDVDVTNHGSSAIMGNLVLNVALVEKEINFPSPPGSNGEMDFSHVMRRLYPNDQGTNMGSSINASQTLTYSLSEPVPNYIYNYAQLAVVVWVQDGTTKQIYNAAISNPLSMPSNALDAGVELGNMDIGLCDNSFEPEVMLVNEGNNDITSATVSYVLNGGAPVNFSYTGTLSSNSSTTITFPSANLNAGATNTIKFTVSNVNGGAFDFNTMNNQTAISEFVILSPNPSTSAFTQGFESVAAGSKPNNMIFVGDVDRVYVFDQTLVNGINYNLGGFSASTKSLRADFPTMSVGDKFEVIIPKIDLTSTPGLFASFNYAYAQWFGTTNDMLAFEASKDCGETWQTLWQKSGADLATAPSITANARFYPALTTSTNSDWKLVPLHLGSLSSETEVVFRFRAESDNGNCLYIDDIMIGTAAVSTEEIKEDKLASAFEASIFPNPAKDRFAIELNVPEQNEVVIEIVNQLGQTVRSNNLGNINGNYSHEVNVDNLAAGMYHIFITVGGERHIKKLTVQK